VSQVFDHRVTGYVEKREVSDFFSIYRSRKASLTNYSGDLHYVRGFGPLQLLGVRSIRLKFEDGRLIRKWSSFTED
jgi:hypothetical protein